MHQITTLSSGRTIWEGLSSETRPTQSIGGNAIVPGSELILSDGGKEEYRGATAGWVQTHDASGAAIVSSPTLTMVKYTSGGYTYICEAALGTARSTAAWRVMRITDSTSDIVFAGAAGSTVGTFAFTATDAATVAALTYTLGA